MEQCRTRQAGSRALPSTAHKLPRHGLQIRLGMRHPIRVEGSFAHLVADPHLSGLMPMSEAVMHLLLLLVVSCIPARRQGGQHEIARHWLYNSMWQIAKQLHCAAGHQQRKDMKCDNWQWPGDQPPATMPAGIQMTLLDSLPHDGVGGDYKSGCISPMLQGHVSSVIVLSPAL